MHTRTLSLIAALSFLLCASFANGASNDWWQVTRGIKLGDSQRPVEAALRQFETVPWSSLTNHYRLHFLRGERVSAWLRGPLRQVGEGYILAVFSSDGKLTDLLRFEPQVRVFPLLRGTYAQRLGSIKKGMSVDELYRLVGEAMPYRYRRDASDWWQRSTSGAMRFIMVIPFCAFVVVSLIFSLCFSAERQMKTRPDQSAASSRTHLTRT